MAESGYTEFTVNVCAVSGDPGCVGWPHSHDGPCQMHQRVCYGCNECGGDDVYGEIIHDEYCSKSISRVTQGETEQ